MSKRKRYMFITVITLAGIFFVFAVSEILLRFRKHHIERSDHLDYGMIVYDNYLGWKLSPNWYGRHKHYDFDVRYSINAQGFRNEFPVKQKAKGLRYAVVGDSFTFAFGVNDNDTFIQLLNSQENRKNVYYNFGVPGYSTDQEYLLIQRSVLRYSPDVILLVVYLGNDLIDNELPYPLQAEHAKPYYELISDEMILRNVPVPRKPKPEEQRKKDLSNVVLGEDLKAHGFIAHMVNRFESLRTLKRALCRTPNYPIRFEEKFNHAIALFTTLVGMIRDVCIEHEVRLSLILMPGRSYVERPDSISAQYQDYMRKSIVENSAKMKVTVIDLAIMLQQRYQKSSGRWFYLHEGHLTAEGHRIISDILLSVLEEKMK